MLSLKQLGYSPKNIEESVARYQEASEIPGDREFLTYIGSNQVGGKPLREDVMSRAQLPIAWSPSSDATDDLLTSGYHPEDIKNVRDDFILLARENASVIANPDAAFLSFFKKRYPQPPEKIPVNWNPCPRVVNEWRQQGRSMKKLRYLTDRFVMYWREEGGRNLPWDKLFMDYLQRNGHASAAKARTPSSAVDLPR